MAKTAATLKVGDQDHYLSERGATLGRASDNTIVLDDDSVSSHHAEILMRDGVYFVRDLGSTNGTTLKGGPVTEAELGSADILSFGTVEAVFLVDPQVLESSASKDQQSTEQSNPSQNHNHLSLRDKIKQFGQAAWAETKRSSHLLSLKAQIEKLTRIDLRQAFHDLGKTCYESKIGEEKFPDHFNAIRSLQERIADGRKGVHAAEGAKTMEKLKAVAQDQAGKITSEALNLKLNELFVGLGKQVVNIADASLPESALRHVRELEVRINALENVYQTHTAEKDGESTRMGANLTRRFILGAAAVVFLLGGTAFIFQQRGHSSASIQLPDASSGKRLTIEAWAKFIEAINESHEEFSYLIKTEHAQSQEMKMAIFLKMTNAAEAIKTQGIDEELGRFLKSYPDEMREVLALISKAEKSGDRFERASTLFRFDMIHTSMLGIRERLVTRYGEFFPKPANWK